MPKFNTRNKVWAKYKNFHLNKLATTTNIIDGSTNSNSLKTPRMCNFIAFN